MNMSVPSPDKPPFIRPLTLLEGRLRDNQRPYMPVGLDYRALFESFWEDSADAMRIIDSQGSVIDVNESYCRLVGMQAGDLTGQPMTMAFHEATDASSLLADYRKRFQERALGHLTSARVRSKSGNELPAETVLSYIRSASGGAFMVTVVRDGAAGSADHRNDDRDYHDLFLNAVQGFFRSTLDGRLLSGNKALVKMLGFDSFEELAAHNLADLYVNPIQREALSVMLWEKGECSNVELELRKKDGTVITVLEHSRAVRTADGKGMEFEGILEDISERKRAEAALQRERNILRTLIDNLPDFIYFKDSEGCYLLNNQAHLRSIGAANQESVLGKSSYDFHPENLARQYHDDEMNIIRSGNPMIDREELAFHKDIGQERWHQTSKIPLHDVRGEVTGVVGISRDITERKELEARMRENLSALQTSRELLDQLNKQKDRLMSVLSHDMRSPFNGILGFCDILLAEGKNLSEAERIEFTTYIRDSAQQQLALLDKLLDWSRLETGRVKFDVRDIDLIEVVSCSVKSHLGTAKQKNIILRSTLSERMLARGDESMLSQAFNNLISNALKFTPAEGTISIDPGDSTDANWVVKVMDSGTGIAQGDLGKLFKVEEKFTRPGLGGEKGTGLGLSVVAEVVKKHSGSVSVESELGKGTTFILTLPKLIQEKEQTVLVVDDDQGIRVLHSRYLQSLFAGAQILQATNGEEALEKAKRYRPRLIVTDYSMPGMNGFELLNLLKQDQATNCIPVIVITGKDSSDGKESLILSGASDVLMKPVSSRQLAVSIEKVMAERI